MDRNTQLQDHLAAQAADWFVRLQDPNEAHSARADFVQWLLRSPQHLEEFLAVSRVWGEANAASAAQLETDELIAQALAQREPDNVVGLRHGIGEQTIGRPDSAPRPGLRGYRFAVAAVIAVAALGSLVWLAADRWLNPAHIRTAIGEQRIITLADGSVLYVNTQSEVRIDFDDSRRQLRLLRGEARFRVASNPRLPFVVSTPQASIRALGTVFNVRTEAERTAVAVLEGRVELREQVRPQAAGSHEERLELKAGEQAAVTPAGRILPNAGPPLERVTAWTDRRLVFREEPLAEVVAEFNRYHRKPILIEAPELAQLRISGTFDANDPDSLLEYFARFERVRVEQGASATRLFMSGR